MLKKDIDILYLAKQKGIDILLIEDQLQLKLPKNGDIDKDFLQEIKDNKLLLVDFLKNNLRKNKNHKVSRVDKKSIHRIPLSFSQERLWFIDQLEGSLEYNLPAVLRLKGNLNKEALKHSFRQIINRHEVLRTVIRE
jgi:hypothetical protein